MPKIFLLLFIFALSSLFAIGVVMIFNTSSAEVLDHALAKGTHQALLKQMLYAIVGLFLGGIMWRLGYQRILDMSPNLLIFFSILLFLALIPGVGRIVNGSRRWIGIAGFSFQPSEFVKYLVPAYFIYYVAKNKQEDLLFVPFLKLIGLLSIPLLLILIEPNNGTAAVIGLTVLVMCILTQIRFKYWAVPLAILVAVAAVSAYQLPYVTARLRVYLHPELDLKGKGHQPYQAKIAVGSGGLFGRGPGNSLQKMSYLPEAQNDYIAAIFAEEFGFVGILILIILYMIMAYIGFYVALTAKSLDGFYFATAITGLICFQAFMNLGVVSGILPSTGLNLPFFSQGGTSLMANMSGLGILLSIAQEKEKEEYV